MRATALHKKLSAQLSSLIPSLDEEGLSFLIEQANVHLYNMEIVRGEEAAAKAEISAKPGKAGGAGKGSRGKQAAAVNATGSQPANFRVERSSSGSSYHLISGGKWKMYNEDEMLSMVRIAKSKDPMVEVAGRLHHWLEEERADTFADLELGDRFDPKMKELVLFLRKKFSVKKP
jgi:hypothetical protein